MTSINLASTLRLLVRPIVRFCLRRSLKLQEVYAALKVEFVGEARHILAESDQPDTLSKISVMTGIPRKFVAGLSGAAEAEEATSNVIARVLGAWHTNPRFGQGHRAKPRRLKCEGANSEFADLVRLVSLDLNPYTILHELERVKLVAREGDSVVLKSSLYLERDAIRAFEEGAHDGHALMKAIEANIESGTSQHLHLTTLYDNIPTDKLDQIRSWLLREGSEFQLRVREYLSQFDRDCSTKSQSSAGRNVIRVVVFEFSETMKED